MTLVLTAGDWSDRSEYISHLVHAGYLVGWYDPTEESFGLAPGMRPMGVVCALDSPQDVEAASALARTLELPWLAWDCAAGASMAAYRMGAVAVLPPDISPADLAQAVSMFLKSTGIGRSGASAAEAVTYQPSEIIVAGADSVVVVISGIVAKRALHRGGSQFLMGLCGPGDVLLGHGPDPHYVELVAHTEAQVAIHRWREVALTWECADPMRRTQTYLTAWASVQSRARVDHRLLGVLVLLAERFGRQTEDDWTMIDVRLTQEQLAEAICATRPTAAKAVRELLPMGAIRFAGAGDFRRVHLRMELAAAILSG